jgi:hypothetical protein
MPPIQGSIHNSFAFGNSHEIHFMHWITMMDDVVQHAHLIAHLEILGF